MERADLRVLRSVPKESCGDTGKAITEITEDDLMKDTLRIAGWLYRMRHYGYAAQSDWTNPTPSRLAESRDHRTLVSYIDGHPWDQIVLGGLAYRR